MKTTDKSVTRQRAELHDIPTDQWAMAEQRLASVRRLLQLDKINEEMVNIEARQLKISRSTLYTLLRRYRENPSINEMLPRKRGVKRGET